MRFLPMNRLKPYLKRKVSEIIMKCVFQHGIVVNAFRSKRLDRNTVNVFVGLESFQTHRKPSDEYYQPRNAQESSNSCSYPNTGY